MVGSSPANDERASVRTLVFDHLAGIVLAPTVKALWDRKVFDLFRGPSPSGRLDEIVEHTHGNRGYLHVALRLLQSAGWMEERIGDSGQRSYALTREGELATSVAPPLYREVVSFIPKALYLEDFLFGTSDEPVRPSLRELVSRAQARWDLGSAEDSLTARVHEQIRGHLDGMLVGPAMVALARGGILGKLEQGPVDFLSIAANHESLSCVFDLLATQDWIAHDHNRVWLTACGKYAAQIATSYGVTVSYLPTFKVVSTFLFGNPRIPRLDETGVELLVNRGMNVWGSGGAHKTYFKKVDEIIVEIFNRALSQQPQGICDMGCGDGSFLEHLYFVVKNHTARGTVLDQNPLILVGADFNKWRAGLLSRR